MALVADVGGEPYAFPITRIARALMLERDELTVFAGHQCFMLDGHRIGVVPAHEVLAVSRTPQWPGAIPVVLLGAVRNGVDGVTWAQSRVPQGLQER